LFGILYSGELCLMFFSPRVGGNLMYELVLV